MPTNGPRPLRILVVDDHEDTAGVLAALLCVSRCFFVRHAGRT